MSRVYWHSEQRTAELLGSERGHLSWLCRGPARAAWNLEAQWDDRRAADIIGLIPEQPPGSYGTPYLHKVLRKVQTTNKDWALLYRQLAACLDAALTGRFADATLMVAGTALSASNLCLNTALVTGSDPVKLAAKIDGWCEVHCWVEGPDRAWLADLIDEGLRSGLYRRGFWVADPAANHPDAPRPHWSDQGWGDVTGLLRERADGPVVLSYSVCDSFPNQVIADWAPEWAQGTIGRVEWENASDSERAEYLDGEAEERWSNLPSAEQWRLAMAGLRNTRPWGRLSPDTLGEVYFGLPISVYDILAPDREQRVRAALAASDDS